MEARTWRSFALHEARIRYCSHREREVQAALVRERAALDEYIRRDPAFRTSLAPMELRPDAPVIARVMERAGRACGVGPMAAVAGAMAEAAARAGLAAGDEDVIVENGGDIFFALARPALVGLYTGATALAGRLAFRLRPGETPVSVCSSSSRLGHSLSFGDCDLACVVGDSGSLADACATMTGNLAVSESSLAAAAEAGAAIPGIRGVLVVRDGKIAIAGRVPELVAVKDPEVKNKITRAEGWVLE